MSPNDTPQTIIIPLTQEQITIVDERDADLFFLKWCAQFHKGYSGNGKFRVLRNVKTNGKYNTIYMARVILSRMLERELVKGELVDHINGDPLDNRRSNLRLANTSQNAMNKTKPSNNTSGRKGVAQRKRDGKWQAYVSVNGKQKNLGFYDTLEEAFEVHCKAAKEHYGEFARLE